ncbi:hypothetical protein TPDSL_18080 [Terrisporobacter petrolearius]
MIELLKLLGYTLPIITGLVSLYKFARNIEKRFDKIDSHFENIDENLNKNTLMTLKLVILNDKLSLDERISAGEEYINLGGNGFVKSYYEKLVERKLQEV